MAKKGTKRKPTYKQMAFETAVRNPERYIEILTAIKDFENKILDDKTLLELVSTLYLNAIVSSDEITVTEETKISDIIENVEYVNSSRRADGGFPSGYASRFWTYMRTPSEFGFVYARYNEPFVISDIAKLLIERKIDEQQAFSVQAIKYNRKNPYRNVSNDFNFFKFIIEVLLELRKKDKSLSYEQFIVAMFSETGSVSEFLEIINKTKFKDFEASYKFIKTKYKATTKFKTITRDYPDVVRRVFIISGFISIRYSGKKLIQLNENKIDFINQLLKLDFNLSVEEKLDAKKYFKKLNSQNEEVIKLLTDFEEEDVIDGDEYVNKIFGIIDTHKINEDIIVNSIKQIGSRKTEIDEFKEIPEPLKLEFFIAILIALKYGKEYAIRPNYKSDHLGKPYSHAPGNTGDIEVFSKDLYWLIEVTLIRNKTQQLNHETTNVIRHLYSNDEFGNRLIKYLSFIAPTIHQDTREFFDYSVVKSKSSDYEVNLKPYTILEFVEITQNKGNFDDMKSYTNNVFDSFRDNLN